MLTNLGICENTFTVLGVVEILFDGDLETVILFVCGGGWFGFVGLFFRRYAGNPHFYSILYSKTQIHEKIVLIYVF